MYIARVPNRASPPAILLRESYREDSKVRTRTLLNITHWAAERIEGFSRLLRGEYDLHPEGFEVFSGKVVGVIYVLREILARLGITKILGRSFHARLCAFMICARVAAQGSRLSSVRWARNHAVAELLNISKFDENDLYQALDWLAEKQEWIEEQLYREYLKQHKKPPTLVLYDVTSSYFEGQYNELAAYGYNRDGKRGKKQVVIGLLADSNGEPLAVRVFRGNSADPATVEEQIKTLKERFKVMHVIFVGDRGMVKSRGKVALASAGFQYVTALTDAQTLTLLREQTIQIGLFDEEVCEVSKADVRYVLRCNNSIKQREQNRRHDKLEKLKRLINERNQYVQAHPRAKLERGLSTLLIWTKSHKINRFVTLSLNGANIELAVDEQAKAKDALLDGCYVVETNVASALLSTEEVHSSYLSLQKVERDFRTMKTGLLEVRPIFLRKGKRTQAHVFIAMLALKTTRLFWDKLAPIQQSHPNFSISDALDSLSRLCFLEFRSPTTLISRLSTPDELQNTILSALSINFPKQLT